MAEAASEDPQELHDDYNVASASSLCNYVDKSLRVHEVHFQVDETVPGVHLTDGDMDQGHYKDGTPSPQTHLALDTTWIVAAEAAVDGAAKPQLAVIHVQGRTR